MQRAVFLDRDGVLNRAVIRDGKPYPPATAAEMIIEPETAGLLIRLKAAGFRLLVVTNQPDIARGKQGISELDAIHQRLRRLLPLDAILVCPHDDADGCECRKPKPGLITAAAQDFGLDIRESYMIGDRWRDVEAGQAAGCKTVFIEYGYRERGPREEPSARVSSLAEAVDWIESNEKERRQDGGE